MKITKGKISKPLFIVCHGLPGVGKSSFAAGAPSPVFIASEDGTSHLDVSRFEDSSSWLQINNNIRSLLKEDHNFKSLIIDSIDWVEPMLWKHICAEQKKDTIDECFGSYGRWVNGVSGFWIDFISLLKTLRDTKHMNIIIIAHTMIKAFHDPTQANPYDRYILKMQEKHAALFIEAVDAVLFANYDIVTQKADKSDKKAKAFGGENRVLFTERRPSFEAKNRMGLPHEMPLNWATFFSAASFQDIESIKSSLVEIQKILPEDVLSKVKSAIERAGDDPDKLLRILNHAKNLI